MKNSKKLLILFTIVLSMLAVSCSTMSKKDYELLSTGKIQDVQLCTKDFEVVGPIRLVLADEYNVTGSVSSTAFSYDTILAEAYKMGADDIINLRVDSTTVVDKMSGTSETTYIVNALAIKYKDAE